MTTVKLRSSNGGEFEVSLKAAKQSDLLKEIIMSAGEDETDMAGHVVPVPQVSTEVLTKVLEYCEKHAAGGMEDELEKWDEEFMADVDMTMLRLVLLAAHYLAVGGLLDLALQTTVGHMRGLLPEEIRRKFDIKNDFTPEEEEKIRKENQWAFEK